MMLAAEMKMYNILYIIEYTTVIKIATLIYSTYQVS